ncbi:unnamed protein product, partial [Rotaria sp. Silwood2]
MLIEVEHWSGAGNRFVIVDYRKKEENIQWNCLVKSLCKRNILADAEGLLVLIEINNKNSTCVYDFYNPDGSTGVMCGNGARCAIKHVSLIENLNNNSIKLVLNGCSYEGKLVNNDNVALRLPLYKELRFIDNWTYVNVGNHHVVIDARDLVKSIEEFHLFNLVKFSNEYINIYRNKLSIYSININLAYLINDQSIIYLRTYENGVFNETQSCGTGAISTAITFWMKNIIRNKIIYLMPISKRLLTVHIDIDD